MAEDDSIQPGDEVWLDSSDDPPEPTPAEAAPTRAQPRRRAGMKIVTEVGVFGVGLGLLLTLSGGALLAAGGGDATVGGIPRRLILAVPMIALGLVHLGSGTLVLLVRQAWTIVLCMLAGAALFVTYCGLMVTTGVGIRFNCLLLVMIAVPAALYLRGREALAELSGRRATRRHSDQRSPTGWRPRPGG